MGRGDIKSKRGKIANGSFGNKRKQRVKKENALAAKPEAKTKKVKETGTSEEGATVKKTKKTTKKTKEASADE